MRRAGFAAMVVALAACASPGGAGGGLAPGDLMGRCVAGLSAVEFPPPAAVAAYYRAEAAYRAAAWSEVAAAAGECLAALEG